LFAKGPQRGFGAEAIAPSPSLVSRWSHGKENCAAMQFGPLSKNQMQESDALLDR
jgi:hypothetical protein